MGDVSNTVKLFALRPAKNIQHNWQICADVLHAPIDICREIWLQLPLWRKNNLALNIVLWGERENKSGANWERNVKVKLNELINKNVQVVKSSLSEKG